MQQTPSVSTGLRGGICLLGVACSQEDKSREDGRVLLVKSSHRPSAELDSNGLFDLQIFSTSFAFLYQQTLSWDLRAIILFHSFNQRASKNCECPVKIWWQRDSFPLSPSLILYHYGSVAWERGQLVPLGLNVLTFLKRNYGLLFSISVMMGDNQDPKKRHRVIHKTKPLAVMITCFSWNSAVHWSHCKIHHFSNQFVILTHWIGGSSAIWKGSQAQLTF